MLTDILVYPIGTINAISKLLLQLMLEIKIYQWLCTSTDQSIYMDTVHAT